jgi:hypothetical protein
VEVLDVLFELLCHLCHVCSNSEEAILHVSFIYGLREILDFEFARATVSEVVSDTSGIYATVGRSVSYMEDVFLGIGPPANFVNGVMDPIKHSLGCVTTTICIYSGNEG